MMPPTCLLRCLCLFSLITIGLTAKTWIDFPALGISYLYYDVCFSFNRANADNICITTYGGDGVASVPTDPHWIAIKSVVNTVPSGTCENFGFSGHEYIGVGATAFNSCSQSEKKNSYNYWNGDVYSNFFEWETAGTINDCNSEKGLHFLYDSKKMDDAPWDHNYAVVCYKELTPDPTSDPTPSPTNNPTPAPTDIPTTDPTIDPTTDPTIDPTSDPTIDPTMDPTTDPTINPATDPTTDPTIDPTTNPTVEPTIDPTNDPSTNPTTEPTAVPTEEPTDDPTVEPTTMPTTNPSIAPTSKPTERAECDNDDNAVLRISFDYELQSNITSRDDIINTLSMAADTFIKEEIGDLTDCDLADYKLYITLSQQVKDARINASICYDCKDGEKLDIDFIESDLERDFIDIVKDTTNILIVTSINEIDVETVNEKAADDATTTTMIVTNDRRKEDKKPLIFDDAVIFLFLIVTICILSLCACCIFIVYCRKKRKYEMNGKHIAADGDGDGGKGTTAEMTRVVSASYVTEHEMNGTSSNMTAETGSSFNKPSDDAIYGDNAALRMWLNNIGLVQYYQMFINHGFGKDISKLKDINDAELMRMGINKMAHRKAIILQATNNALTSDLNTDALDVDIGEDLPDEFDDNDLYNPQVQQTTITPMNGAGTLTSNGNEDEDEDEEYEYYEEEYEEESTEGNDDNELYKQSNNEIITKR